MLPMLRNRFFPALSEPSLLGQWSDLRREIDRWFESTLPGTLFASTWNPAMDVQETEDAVRLTFEIPGVNPDDVSVTVENGILTIAGEKKFEHEGRDEKSGGRSFERLAITAFSPSRCRRLLRLVHAPFRSAVD